MRFKSLKGLVSVLFVSLFILSLIVSFVDAKPVGRNPGTSWPSGTFWGTNLHFENGIYSQNAWFGTRATELKIGAPPDPPDGLVVEFFDNNVRTATWVKVPADHENWPVRLRTVGAAPGSGTLSSTIENADTLFMPQDFSVVLENAALSLRVNLRNENKFIDSLPLRATLYVDNAVNIQSIDNLDPLTGQPGDTLRLNVHVQNTGRYNDNYAVSAGGSLDPTILNLAPGSTDNVIVTTTLPAGTDVPVVVTAAGNYATDQDSILATGTSDIVFRAYPTGYATDTAGGIAPWVLYGLNDNAPMAVAKQIGSGSVFAGAFLGDCGYFRNASYPSADNLDVLFNEIFQWMVPGATNIIWYDGDSVYSGSKSSNTYVKRLLDNLRTNFGYTIDNQNLLRLDNLGSSTYDILVLNQEQDGTGALGGDPSLIWDNELDAVRNWVASGKGVFFNEVSDYLNYDYNRVVNKFLDNLGFGWWFQHDTLYDNTANDLGAAYKPQLVRVVGNPIGDAYAAASGRENILGYKSDTLIQRPTLGVSETASPAENVGENGTTITFIVTVTNNASVWDNFQLTFENDNSWTTTILPSNLMLDPGDNGSATLSVLIPVDAPSGSVEHINVKATSFWDNTVSDNKTVTARCLIGRVELDDQNGNFVNLFNTIQSAIDNAGAGYTVIAFARTFTENLYVNKENLRIISLSGAANTIIDASGAENAVNIVSKGIIFGGFTLGNATTIDILLDNSSNSLIENNIIDSASYGIYLKQSNNNRIENNLVENGEYGIYLFSSENNNLSRNSIVNNGTGIDVYGDLSGNGQVTITRNMIDSNADYGIYFESPMYGNSVVMVENNSIQNNGDEGVSFNDNIYEDSSVELAGNTIDNNDSYGVYFDYYIYDSAMITITGNTIENNSWEGVYFYYSIYGNSKVNIVNNSISNNGSEGLYFYYYIYDSANVTVTGNTIDSNSMEGIHFDYDIFGNSTVTISHNSISNNDSYGVYVGYPIYDSANLTISWNSIDNNNSEGIYFDDDIYDNSLVQVENNSISNNDSEAIYFNYPIYDNSKVMIIGNMINNNSSDAIDLGPICGNSLVQVENNSISNNSDTGIYFLHEIYGNSIVTIKNNSISNNDGDGIYFDDYIHDNAMVEIVGNVVNNNGYYGIDDYYYCYGIDFGYEIYGNSNIWIENNITSNNYWEGIDFEDDIYDNATIRVIGNICDNAYDSYGIDFDGAYISGNAIITLENNSFSNNDYEGIDIDSYIEENSRFSIVGNNIENNWGYGIDFDGADIYGNSIVTIKNNSISNNEYEGIYFGGDIYEDSFIWIDNNSISNNGIYATTPGICFVGNIYDNAIVLVTRNTIDSNGEGIFVNANVDAPLIIFANNITTNVAPVGPASGVHIASEVDSIGVIIGFNNILGNTPYGVFNGGLDIIHAPYNYWGDASGPGGAGPGTGIVDNISEDVIFRPWISSPFEQLFMGCNFAGYVSEGLNNVNPTMLNLNLKTIPETAAVSFDGKDTGGMVITMFRAIGGAPIPSGLKSAFFMDISTIPENIAENFQITIHYTDGDVSGIDESSLKLYYWSSTDNLWHLCNDISVNTSANTISASIDHLTPFGIFGSPGAVIPPTAAGVEISITPSTGSGRPGNKLSYTVTVTNTGGATDTFDLGVHGGTAWSPIISNNSLTLAAGASGEVTLELTVPSWANAGLSTTITVTATSMADPSVSASASCKAVVSAPISGPVSTAPTGTSWLIVLVIAGGIAAIIVLIVIIVFFEK